MRGKWNINFNMASSLSTISLEYWISTKISREMNFLSKIVPCTLFFLKKVRNFKQDFKEAFRTLSFFPFFPDSFQKHVGHLLIWYINVCGLKVFLLKVQSHFHFRTALCKIQNLFCYVTFSGFQTDCLVLNLPTTYQFNHFRI